MSTDVALPPLVDSYSFFVVVVGVSVGVRMGSVVGDHQSHSNNYNAMASPTRTERLFLVALKLPAICFFAGAFRHFFVSPVLFVSRPTRLQVMLLIFFVTITTYNIFCIYVTAYLR